MKIKNAMYKCDICEAEIEWEVRVEIFSNFKPKASFGICIECHQLTETSSFLKRIWERIKMK